MRERNYSIDPRSMYQGRTFQAGLASKRQDFYQKV